LIRENLKKQITEHKDNLVKDIKTKMAKKQGKKMVGGLGGGLLKKFGGLELLKPKAEAVAKDD
jgi:hypothetical protein